MTNLSMRRVQFRPCKRWNCMPSVRVGWNGLTSGEDSKSANCEADAELRCQRHAICCSKYQCGTAHNCCQASCQTQSLQHMTVRIRYLTLLSARRGKLWGSWPNEPQPTDQLVEDSKRRGKEIDHICQCLKNHVTNVGWHDWSWFRTSICWVEPTLSPAMQRTCIVLLPV